MRTSTTQRSLSSSLRLFLLLCLALNSHAFPFLPQVQLFGGDPDSGCHALCQQLHLLPTQGQGRPCRQCSCQLLPPWWGPPGSAERLYTGHWAWVSGSEGDVGDSGSAVYLTAPLPPLFFNPFHSGLRVVTLPSGAMRTLYSSDRCAEPGMCGNSWRGSWNAWKSVSVPARGTISVSERSAFLVCCCPRSVSRGASFSSGASGLRTCPFPCGRCALPVLSFRTTERPLPF